MSPFAPFASRAVWAAAYEYNADPIMLVYDGAKANADGVHPTGEMRLACLIDRHHHGSLALPRRDFTDWVAKHEDHIRYEYSEDENAAADTAMLELGYIIDRFHNGKLTFAVQDESGKGKRKSCIRGGGSWRMLDRLFGFCHFGGYDKHPAMSFLLEPNSVPRGQNPTAKRFYNKARGRDSAPRGRSNRRTEFIPFPAARTE